MALPASPLSLDRDLRPIAVGDHVRFIARGFFYPREQESFGIIEALDEFGGVKIKMIAGYKHFLSSKKVGDVDDSIYFTHHRYDAKSHARVYSVMNGEHELFIALFDCYKEPA